MDLVKIESPAFLKTLSLKELESLAQEVREMMISSMSKTGGHLASNLASVELTIGLHRVFNSPADKILFDPVHQSYTHKVLTGRAAQLQSMLQTSNLSTFQSNSESIHDPYEANYLGQSLSVGYGLSMINDADEIISVISEATLNQGSTYEALNHISSNKKKIIIIINDSSDATSIGAISSSLKNIAFTKPITQFRDDMSTFFEKGNVITGPIKRSIKGITTTIGKTVSSSNIFTELGLKYIGPFDGHKINDIVRVLRYAQNVDEPIVVHFKTIKGKGYKAAHNELKGLWVDLNQFDPNTGQHLVDLPKGVLSAEDQSIETLKELIATHQDFVVINLLERLESKLKFLKGRVYHVQNSLKHGFSFASGLALGHLKPILLCDSHQLLSSIDSVLSEIGMMSLPITVIVFKSGLLSKSGGYQDGIYDLSLLNLIPEVIISQVKNNQELHELITLSLSSSKPMFIKVQESNTTQAKGLATQYQIGQWEMLNLNQKPQAIILTYGNQVDNYTQRVESNNLNLWVVNMRFIKPFDQDALHYCFQQQVPITLVTEDFGGHELYQELLNFKKQHGYDANLNLLSPELKIYPYGHIAQIRKLAHLDTLSVLNSILADLEVKNS